MGELNARGDVLANYTTENVEIRSTDSGGNILVTMRLSPSDAMAMARSVMRAAFSLGYVEPEEEKAES